MAALQATGDTPAWPEDAIEVGRIIDAWGVKGWIKILPFAADPQALFSSRRWFLKPAEPQGPRRVAPSAAASIPPVLKITQVRHHGDGVVAQAQGVEDRSAAEALKGVRIFVSRASFPSTAEDEFYWVDLIGLTVVNQQGEVLGEVADLLDTGPHCVLRVVGEAAGEGVEPTERLIPFVSAYVGDVSLAERRITVDWGLDY